MNIRISSKIIISAVASILILCLTAGIGSVSIPAREAFAILGSKLFHYPMPADIDPITVSIFWSIRLPRTISAFLVGASLAVSGTVMQSVLQNPLASSYTLGVSSGASLGAGVIIVSGFYFAGKFTLPLTGFIFGLVTVFIAITLSYHFDHNMQNQTIILVGMVVSLFVNAILTLLTVLDSDHLHELYMWQMGTFSSKTWEHVAMLLPVAIFGTLLTMMFSRKMDIMTFGDEQAMSIGVDTKSSRLILIIIAAFMTGTSICFTGTIGFIDLIAPHVVRRVFGSRHKYVVPMSALFGGAFMALSDMAARTLLSPRELPVGAVTAIIGAPFFTYVFFRKKRV